jgi:hypothetical protein
VVIIWSVGLGLYVGSEGTVEDGNVRFLVSINVSAIHLLMTKRRELARKSAKYGMDVVTNIQIASKYMERVDSLEMEVCDP